MFKANMNISAQETVNQILDNIVQLHSTVVRTAAAARVCVWVISIISEAIHNFALIKRTLKGTLQHFTTNNCNTGRYDYKVQLRRQRFYCVLLVLIGICENEQIKSKAMHRQNQLINRLNWMKYINECVIVQQFILYVLNNLPSIFILILLSFFPLARWCRSFSLISREKFDVRVVQSVTYWLNQFIVVVFQFRIHDASYVISI